jgi:ribosomal protein S18 acetylase RimI-like enzyme
MVVIRAASTADAPQIAAVIRDSWFAAYEGIIADQIIDRVTAPDDGARVRQSFGTRPWQRMIAAVAPCPRPAAAEAEAAAASGIVGYASFGPELNVLGMSWPYPRTAAGAEGRVAELYALYVRPAWWSTGTGRALMDHVLARVSVAGYRCITLWVLEDNARARRFYERAGFTPDGASHGLPDLGGVTEIRYRRALRAGPGATRQPAERGTQAGDERPGNRRDRGHGS